MLRLLGTCLEKGIFIDEKENYLATKFVVGLGRVREVFVVYWREIGEDERE